MKTTLVSNHFVTQRHIIMNRLRMPLMFVLVLIFSLSGCNKYLNIQPQESIDQSLALNSAQDVQNVLIGAYSNLGDQYLWGGQLMMEPDLLAATNELTWGGTY